MPILKKTNICFEYSLVQQNKTDKTITCINSRNIIILFNESEIKLDEIIEIIKNGAKRPDFENYIRELDNEDFIMLTPSEYIKLENLIGHKNITSLRPEQKQKITETSENPLQAIEFLRIAWPNPQILDTCIEKNITLSQIREELTINIE